MNPARADLPAVRVPPRPPRLPPWLKRPLAAGKGYQPVTSCIQNNRLHTVCVEARCPNRAECFSAGTATFLIMGNVCTRGCAFCGISHGTAAPPDPGEPVRIAKAVAHLGLRHIVITSVTRDDLSDGGAAHFVQCVAECRKHAPEATIELLIPDLGGDHAAIAAVMGCRPDVLNHNLETVPRLYDAVRPGADYSRSLDIIEEASRSGLVAKSGLMLGLGETPEEIHAVLGDLKRAGCSIVTIGQYLCPGRDQIPVARFETPQTFETYARLGRELGIGQVIAGPFVRSSYHAHEALLNTTYSTRVMV